MPNVARKKEIDKTFGQRLRLLRESRGMTQAELGEKVRMGYQEISRIERGEREPTWSIIRKLADALEATPDDFLPSK